MKKTNKPLFLSRETVRALSSVELVAVAGRAVQNTLVNTVAQTCGCPPTSGHSLHNCTM